MTFRSWVVDYVHPNDVNRLKEALEKIQEDGRIFYDEMIEQADRALYRAKKDGKNCYRLYQEEEPAD